MPSIKRSSRATQIIQERMTLAVLAQVRRRKASVVWRPRRMSRVRPESSRSASSMTVLSWINRSSKSELLDSALWWTFRGCGLRGPGASRLLGCRILRSFPARGPMPKHHILLLATRETLRNVELALRGPVPYRHCGSARRRKAPAQRGLRVPPPRCLDARKLHASDQPKARKLSTAERKLLTNQRLDGGRDRD